MIELATSLGMKAIKTKKYFNMAVIYGSVRNVDGIDVLPYKLTMDFEGRALDIKRSKATIGASAYISAVKYILDNPEAI